VASGKREKEGRDSLSVSHRRHSASSIGAEARSGRLVGLEGCRSGTGPRLTSACSHADTLMRGEHCEDAVQDCGVQVRRVERSAGRGATGYLLKRPRSQARIGSKGGAQWPAPRRIASRRLYSYKLETFQLEEVEAFHTADHIGRNAGSGSEVG
jgi:hypothetical protein